MKCNKCGVENLNEGLFCSNCGAKLSEDRVTQDNKSIKLKNMPKFFKNKRNTIIVCISSVIIIFTIGIIIYNNNPIAKFESAIKSDNQTEATLLYSSKIKGDNEKEIKVSVFLKDQLSEIEKQFIDEKIDYDEANTKCETIKNTGLISSDVNSSLTKIINLNNSRIAFGKAESLIKENDYLNAIKEYKNVIVDDKNYEKAGQEIEKNMSTYKEQVLKAAQESANSNDYNKAVSILEEAKSIIENDADITTNLTAYNVKLESIKAEKAKTEQLLVVDSVKIAVQSDKYKSLYPDQIRVMITNKSDKTVKNMNVGFLGYDSNGYPLKIKMQFDFLGSNYEGGGNADNVNIIPGASFGDNVGWDLDKQHGLTTVISCVKTVEFYDGTKWTNPYYDYWIGKYKEKQLK